MEFNRLTPLVALNGVAGGADDAVLKGPPGLDDALKNGEVVPPVAELETTLGAEDVKKPPIVVIAGPPGSDELVGKEPDVMRKPLVGDVMPDEVAIGGGQELDGVEVNMRSPVIASRSVGRSSLHSAMRP